MKELTDSYLQMQSMKMSIMMNLIMKKMEVEEKDHLPIRGSSRCLLHTCNNMLSEKCVQSYQYETD